MSTAVLTRSNPFPKLTSARLELDPERVGELRNSTDLLGNGNALRERMEQDGYLFLPGYLDREEVKAARHEVALRLAAGGYLDTRFPVDELVAPTDSNQRFRPDLAQNNQPLLKLLYSGRMMEFFTQLLGGEVRHFDFTWMRAVSPGGATSPHCDIVYMGRGTTNLFTAWTPLCDVPIEMGGLMLLENSHHHQKLKEGYGRKDVDTYCSNRREEGWTNMGGGGNIASGGVLSHNPVRLRERMGGRWLTSEYRMGDLLVFCMYIVHASLDNHSNRIRISSDTRYQLASDPVDERWIGDNPIAHGNAAKRGRVC